MHASSFDGNAQDFEANEASPSIPTWRLRQPDDGDDSPETAAREMVAAFQRFTSSSAKKNGPGNGKSPTKGTKPNTRQPKSGFEVTLAAWVKLRRKNGQVIDPYFPDSKTPSELFREQLRAGFERVVS